MYIGKVYDFLPYNSASDFRQTDRQTDRQTASDRATDFLPYPPCLRELPGQKTVSVVG